MFHLDQQRAILLFIIPNQRPEKSLVTFGWAASGTQLTHCNSEANWKEGKGQIITCHVEECFSATHKHTNLASQRLQRTTTNNCTHSQPHKAHINNTTSKAKKNTHNKTTNSRCQNKMHTWMGGWTKLRTTQQPNRRPLEGRPHQKPQRGRGR